MRSEAPLPRKPVQHPTERRRQEDKAGPDNNAAKKSSDVSGRALNRLHHALDDLPLVKKAELVDECCFRQPCRTPVLQTRNVCWNLKI